MAGDNRITVRQAVVLSVDLRDRFLSVPLMRLLKKKHDAPLNIYYADDDDENDDETPIHIVGELQTPQELEAVKETIRTFLNFFG